MSTYFFGDPVGHPRMLPADRAGRRTQGNDGARRCAPSTGAGPLIDDRFRADPANRALFLKILQQPRGLVPRAAADEPVRHPRRYLPNFGAIVGQMQHDLFHIYTVDQHILMVVRNLRRFTMEEFAHEYPFCTRLISEFDKRWLLFIAALFHDIARAAAATTPSRAGDARTFCEQHGLTAEDTELVVWLVRNHLTMSNVAQKQDISDPTSSRPLPTSSATSAG